MPELKLIAARWRQRVDGGTVLHRRGDLVEVDEEQAAWLIKSGAAIDPSAATETKVKPAPSPQEPEAEESEPKDGPERPLNAANKAAWEDYYRAVKGQDPKNMDKAEIIAAVG